MIELSVDMPKACKPVATAKPETAIRAIDVIKLIFFILFIFVFVF